MFDTVSERRKVVALNHLMISNMDGTINIEATLQEFQNLLAIESEKVNAFSRVMLPIVEAIMQKNCTEFVSTDNLKFLSRSQLERQGYTVTAEEVADWIANAVNHGFLYSRHGRGGGIQLWENAKHICARTIAKRSQITPEILEKAEAHMHSERAK